MSTFILNIFIISEPLSFYGKITIPEKHTHRFGQSGLHLWNVGCFYHLFHHAALCSHTTHWCWASIQLPFLKGPHYLMTVSCEPGSLLVCQPRRCLLHGPQPVCVCFVSRLPHCVILCIYEEIRVLLMKRAAKCNSPSPPLSFPQSLNKCEILKFETCVIMSKLRNHTRVLK